jgi:hypothetical protein
MSGNCTANAPELCGCCDGVSVETPEPIYNRPGLPAIAYRAGRYQTFLASLQARLSSSDVPALALLRTRDSSDFTMGLLDAWAITLDILTFYQERLANEAYLRTAIESRSVMELAALVGYQPSPGVGASTTLAFTLSSAAGSPDNVLIAKGTRVQSVPPPGQQPQVFETSSDITATIAGNAIPAQLTTPWTVASGATSTWIAGVANNLNVGDALLVVAAPGGQPAAGGPADFVYLTAVQLDSTSGNTQIFWNTPLANNYGSAACLYVFRKKAALFGVNAVSPLQITPKPGGLNATGTDWAFSYAGSGRVSLDASYAGLAPDASAAQWVVLTNASETAFYQITAATEANPVAYALSSKVTQLTLSSGTSLAGTANLGTFVTATRSTTAYVQSELLTPASLPRTLAINLLQPGMIVPVQGSVLALAGGLGIVVSQPIGVSGKATRLQVMVAPAGNAFTPAGSSTAVAVALNQQFVITAYPPTLDPKIGGNLVWSVLTNNNVAGTLSLPETSVQLVPSAKGDPIVSESATVSKVTIKGDVTTLALHPALTGIYDATTLTVNTNAVTATQGETQYEILGSGDATNPALAFKLKQSPLTYVSSSNGNGAASTLQVWVNNLLWQQDDDLLEAGSRDRVYVTSADQNQSVTVQFGDGEEGARPPTGQANIRAVYRKGIGSAGNVAGGSLSQALDRPQGLKAVTNPDAATGGADPDTAADARASAPLEVLTLGRVVSLDDYQNYALAFAGIAKALATWTWSGHTRAVYLSVAGEGGCVYKADDATLTNLRASLWSHGNPYVPITIASCTQVLFEVGANVLISADYEAVVVMAAVWTALANAFSFARMRIGQGVAQSQVIALIQQTPGVAAVELTAFNRQGMPGVAQVVRAASPAAGQQTTPMPAELLLLDPGCQGKLKVWS